MKLLSTRDDIPDGLTPGKAENFVSGATRNASSAHISYLLAAWRALPFYEFIDLPVSALQELRDLKEKTGIGAAALLRGKRLEKPEGLSPSVINRLLKNGGTARKDHIDYLLLLWRSKLENLRIRVPITDAYVEALRAQKNRSGVGASKLFRTLKNPPEKITAITVMSWTSRNVKAAYQCDMDYVLKEWARLPSISRYRKITKPLLEELLEYKERSGIGSQRFLGLCDDVPEGLTHSTLENWLRGSVKSAQGAHIDYVRENWRRICEQNEYPQRLSEIHGASRILQDHRAAGFLPSKIFHGASDVPEGLSVAIISGWLAKPKTRVRKNHVDWVLHQCQALQGDNTRRINLTDGMRDALEFQIRRTNVGATALLKNKDNVPDKVNAATIIRWINYPPATVRKDHYEFVLGAWEALPDKV